jgi:DNA-binding transcriptional ArsR family regulator
MLPPADGEDEVWLITVELDLAAFEEPDKVCTAFSLARRYGNLEVFNPLSEDRHFIRVEATGEFLSVRRRSPRCPFYMLSTQLPLHVSTCVVSQNTAKATLICGGHGLRQLRERLAALGARYRVLRAKRLGPRGAMGATRKQWLALLTAFHMGYFDTPARAGIREVAAALGKSPSTVSELLKRGLRNIVAAQLLTAREEELAPRAA